MRLKMPSFFIVFPPHLVWFGLRPQPPSALRSRLYNVVWDRRLMPEGTETSGRRWRGLGGRSIMVRSINWSDVKRKVEEMTWVSNPALSAGRAVSDPVRKGVAKR